MKVTASEISAVLPEAQKPQVTQAKSAPVPAAGSEVHAKPAVPQSSQPIGAPTAVSLRRDNSGKIYYVVSDAKSGQEILEFPPKVLRAVDQGIDEYLKERSKESAHLKVSG